MESGSGLKHLVLFKKGQPASDITYNLYDQLGSILFTGSAPIALGQLSYLIEIDGSSNVLSLPLFEQMTLEWTYTTDTELVKENYKYRLHAPINFSVSIESVRNLLGVDPEELPDEEIDLFSGYLSFLSLLPNGVDLSEYENAGTLDSYKIAIGIEAAAALEIFPTLQIRLPKKYNSGSSEYERWTNVDWEALKAQLNSKMVAGLTIVNPNLELFPIINIFGVSDPDVDAVTGA